MTNSIQVKRNFIVMSSGLYPAQYFETSAAAKAWIKWRQKRHDDEAYTLCALTKRKHYPAKETP